MRFRSLSEPLDLPEGKPERGADLDRRWELLLSRLRPMAGLRDSESGAEHTATRIADYVGALSAEGLEFVLYEFSPEAFECLVNDLEIIACKEDAADLRFARSVVRVSGSDIGQFVPSVAVPIRRGISEVQLHLNRGIERVSRACVNAISPS